MAFVPQKKDSIKEEIKKHFMDGDIIRCDGRDDKPIEVIGRDFIKDLPTMRNIGMESDKVYKTINCSHKVFHEVVEELRKEYSVSDIWCSHSGCCQYATYGYYLD